MSENGQEQSPPPGQPKEEHHEAPRSTRRKTVVVVGLGMVGIAFIEKLMKLDEKRREYDIIVIGEGKHTEPLVYTAADLVLFLFSRASPGLQPGGLDILFSAPKS